jgi:hypothetical protein
MLQLINEQGLYMFLIQVFRYQWSDNLLISFYKTQEIFPMFSGNLVSDMKELSEISVEIRMPLIVAQGSEKLLRIPFLDNFGCRKVFPVNIDNGRIGSSKLVIPVEGSGIDFFSQRQTIATGNRQPGKLLKPGSPGGLDVKSFPQFLIERAIDG